MPEAAARGRLSPLPSVSVGEGRGLWGGVIRRSASSVADSGEAVELVPAFLLIFLKLLG